MQIEIKPTYLMVIKQIVPIKTWLPIWTHSALNYPSENPFPLFWGNLNTKVMLNLPFSTKKIEIHICFYCTIPIEIHMKIN